MLLLLVMTAHCEANPVFRVGDSRVCKAGQLPHLEAGLGFWSQRLKAKRGIESRMGHDDRQDGVVSLEQPGEQERETHIQLESVVA
jgi:hypothetical protein